MLTEIRNVRQVQGEGARRWFTDEYFDLIVWYGDNESMVGFQLCYDKGRAERALTWEPATGLIHSAVDDGEFGIGLRHKATPVLAPDGALDLPRLAGRFRAASPDVPARIVEFVAARLRE